MKDRNKAYYRLDAETRLRAQCVDFAIRCMKILPHTYKNVLDLAGKMHVFIKSELREDINKLPSDIVEGLKNKYGDSDPFEDLT